MKIVMYFKEVRILKIGDVVVLNSGGVPMTISYVNGSNCVCAWYNEGVYTMAFPKACLTLKNSK